MSDLKDVVRQALAEGANPRGFSVELTAAYEEVLAEEAKESEKKSRKK